MSDSPIIRAIPTNIITGFLGVGKTSAILHLLKSKPANERWALLINEFGEIGVDGSLFKGRHSEEHGVFIREVPGGCMCCAAGLPMQIALNQLLIHARPDHLLIEPTGLGHPREVLQVLSTEHYQKILDLQKILTLVDARKLSDERYTKHETFNQQIGIADIIVGNKIDLYQREDNVKLETYVKRHGSTEAQLIFTQNGEIAPAYLLGKTSATTKSHHHHTSAKQEPLLSEVPIPECGYIKAINKGEGFYSTGWRFSPVKIFDRKSLFNWLSGLKVERAKGVFITSEGVYGYNITSDSMAEVKLDDCIESRIEIIGNKEDLICEDDLFKCIVS